MADLSLAARTLFDETYWQRIFFDWLTSTLPLAE